MQDTSTTTPDDTTTTADGVVPEPVSAGIPLTSLATGDVNDAIHDDAWAKPKPRTNRRLTVLATTLAVALFGIGTFTAGAKMAKKSTTSGSGRNASGGLGALLGGGTGAFPGGFGGGGGGGRSGRIPSGSGGSGATAAGSDALAAILAGGTGTSTGAPAIQGKVTAFDATTITVTKDDGTTATITLDSKATVARRTDISAKDIAVGDNVSAEGAVDTAGNVAATTVTVGDLPAAGAAATADQPTPATGDDLGGLLGG